MTQIVLVLVSLAYVVRFCAHEKVTNLNDLKAYKISYSASSFHRSDWGGGRMPNHGSRVNQLGGEQLVRFSYFQMLA